MTAAPTQADAEHRVPDLSDLSDPDWWRQAVVYQVYPRAFADTDGDGIGDIRGITAHVDHLATLGVDAVWLSPFYPSPLADGGYDVSDHRDVDPRLGTLEDFDAMVTALHAAGIRVVVDIVPNHTSDQHAWFHEALASPPGSVARGRYVFRDGLGPEKDQPPSTLRALFGGSAWQAVGDGQFYLHLFAPEQPDLDWSRTEVREDFHTTLRFWADRGVDGFRVDVAHALVKDLDALLAGEVEILESEPRTDGSHPLWDRDDVQEVYAGWRGVMDSYDPPRAAVAEAHVHPKRRARYADPASLGQSFNFDFHNSRFDAAEMRAAITSGVAQAAEGASCTWTINNHDSVRAVSRYAVPARTGSHSHRDAIAWITSDGREPVIDTALGLRRARAAALLEMALPGSVYLYQGEELGLPEVADLPWDVLQDPLAIRSAGVEKGRDGCRVPLPWTRNRPSFGFGPGGADLPQPAWFADVSVEAQESDPSSTLTMYRRALALRRELMGPEELTFIDDPAGDSVVHVERPGGWRCVTNFGPEPVALPDGEVLLTSTPLLDGLLPSDTSAWCRVRGSYPAS